MRRYRPTSKKQNYWRPYRVLGKCKGSIGTMLSIEGLSRFAFAAKHGSLIPLIYDLREDTLAGRNLTFPDFVRGNYQYV